MPETRSSVVHKFTVGDCEGFLIVGFYDDGRPGEIFINMSREGSTIGGLTDAVAALTSIALQSGVPLKDLVHKFAYSRFEPSGPTRSKEVGTASSILDYIFRWMGHHFIKEDGYNPNQEPKALVNETSK